MISTEAIGSRWYAVVEWRVWGFLWKRRATIVQFTDGFSRSEWYFAETGKPLYNDDELNRLFTIARDKDEALEKLLEETERPPLRLKAVK